MNKERVRVKLNIYYNLQPMGLVMFTMAKIKDTFTVGGAIGKSNYLDSHLIHNDYYSEKGKVTGKWIGKLASILGLEGKEIKEGDQVFEDIRKNINPVTKEKLTPRNRTGGIRFYDFQCSAQKTVSIMAVTMGDARLRKAHQTAFDFAIKELEKFAARRDNSSPGVLKEPITTGNIMAGAFHHDASRSLDPQLHTHCVVANATYDEAKGKILSLQESNMVRAIRYAGKVYQNELAKNVRECGYEIENKINAKGIIEGFEIVGVSEDIQKRFSKRRTVIDTEIEKFRDMYGRKPTTEEINIITKESRSTKLAEITTEQVIKEQRQQLNNNEFSNLTHIKHQAITKSQNNPNLELHKQ
ncbi:MAG: relaxase domain-containing protein, partial [Lentisphaerae bacterium]|nr:relaxase domain-containing protein [Lentisphaerota bacterium]